MFLLRPAVTDTKGVKIKILTYKDRSSGREWKYCDYCTEYDGDER